MLCKCINNLFLLHLHQQSNLIYVHQQNISNTCTPTIMSIKNISTSIFKCNISSYTIICNTCTQTTCETYMYINNIYVTSYINYNYLLIKIKIYSFNPKHFR